MNNNRSHDYKNYMNSYGMQEIRREARMARMLIEARSGMPGVEKAKQMVLRFAGVVIAISLSSCSSLANAETT